MGTMKIMDGSGDRVLGWDVQVQEQVQQASDTFNDLVAQHYGAYGSRGHNTPEQIETFDETLDRIVMVPALAGG